MQKITNKNNKKKKNTKHNNTKHKDTKHKDTNNNGTKHKDNGVGQNLNRTRFIGFLLMLLNSSR